MKRIYYLPILFIGLFSCTDKDANSVQSLFHTTSQLSKTDSHIEDDDLAYIEGIHCNDRALIVQDFHSGESYTLFDINSGKAIRRFGLIGQGPNEIPLGTEGYIENEYFYLFYDFTGYIGKYSIDSLRKRSTSHPYRLAKYQLEDAQLSAVVPLNDSVFLGAGTYKSEFQYLLFDKNNEIIDYNVKIYNADYDNYNKYHKFLSNQGTLRKHPNKNLFVYSLNFSSNLDFIEIKDSKINPIKSLHFGNPDYQPVSDGGLNRVMPLDDNTIGYLDICATDKYVYALYTNKKLFVDDKGNKYNSNTVLVFDWDGNPVKELKLTEEAYYICVNENQKRLYAAVTNASSGWSIVSYEL